MVKKILSSIILIMIICSSYVYATTVIIPEDPGNSSQESIKPENNTTSNESEDEDNNETENKTDTSTDENDKESSDTDNNTNIGNNDNTDKENDGNKENNNENDKDKENNEDKNDNDKNETNNNQTGNNIEKPKEENNKNETNKDNSGTTNNNIVTKSSEARLKELKVDVEGLTPNFDKNTTEYYLVVDLSVKQIKVTAKTVDSKAKITITGNKNLKEGENRITINVAAEDGTTKKYYIYVTKIDNVELANAELEVLEIEGVNIYPTFKPNIYSYNLNINKAISDLNITAKPQREKAKVEIEGNSNLQEGENLIKITVTAEDETTVRTYKINTYIDSNRVEIQEESKIPAIILIIILSSCIIGLGIYMVIKNRR